MSEISPSNSSSFPPLSKPSSFQMSNRSEIFTVLLSLIPVASILFLYLFLNRVLETNDVQMHGFLYTFVILSLFFVGNVIGSIAMSSIMQFSIYWRSCLLMNGLLVGLMLVNQDYSAAVQNFGFYLMSLCFFHLSEFVCTALFNQKQVSVDSFLLNHSAEYGVAAVSSWLEWSIEMLLFPSFKANIYLRYTGLALVIFGECFRKGAMCTAGTNFNHYVQETRQQDHVLVNWGIYSLVRHPSYFGWFYWSIGTQLILANPVCVVLYAVVSWKFFKSRILYEEFYLHKFFGKKYSKYQQQVSSGIPFVKGYRPSDETLD